MVADALAPYVARTSAAMIIVYVEYVGPGFTWGSILINPWRAGTELSWFN